MSSNKEVLQSCLFEAGAKFSVSEIVKDNTLGPGSLGFVSYVEGLDESYQNLAKVLVTIVRRGKSGKERLNVNTIYVPIFHFESENFAKLMPDSTRKYYVHIEREIPSAYSVMDLSDVDFVGWASAMVLRLKKMNESCRHKKWPEDKGNPLNQMKRALDHFDEDPESNMQKLASPEFRIAFTDECRRKESAMVKMQLDFDLKKLEAELNAAEFLLFTNKGEFIPEDAEDKTNEYEFTKDNDFLERSVAYYTKIRDKVVKLSEAKRQKKE